MQINPADTTSVLAGLLQDPLVVVDVGCRWGFADPWGRLGSRCMLIGFDPDAAECERLRELYEGNHGIQLVPLGLGGASGKATLYITQDPGGYSLYPTGDDVVARHPSLAGGRVVGTEEVEITTLDEWAATAGIGHVDVIKLDTQGSELSILEGASSTLDHVRAVEVEVEFNPLYDGVPLFGDIDAYLREKGFVLWRLRDLSHYAQAGASADWRATDFQYYDRHVARVDAGSGQLFWANAFYLRSAVAYPEADAGWESLVRDACITSALGFHDLSGLAMERAERSAPADKVGALRVAASEDLVLAWRERWLAEQSAILREPVTIDADDERFQGSGWLPPQRHEQGAVRWSGPLREASIDVPYVLSPGAKIELFVVAAMTPAIMQNLKVEVNRVPVPITLAPIPGGVLCSGILPAGSTSDRRFTRLVVRTVETVPWNQAHVGSTDDTELGVAVSWVRFAPPEELS